MINDEIITREKLIQYDEVIGIETWEEVAKIVDTNILGEMDWYLLDGLMNDYLLCSRVEESKPFLEGVENTILEFCVDYATADWFIQMADELDYE